MKSFEYRIRKLEKSLRVEKQDEQIFVILRNYYTECAERYHGKCPYLEENAECPLYKERLKVARERSPNGLVMFTLPCFKEGECPLCLDSPITPTSKGDQSSHEMMRKENE